MSETMRNIRVAYSKGVDAAKNSNDIRCPYGSTKKELQCWFRAGVEDYKRGCVDRTMYGRAIK